MSQHTHTANRDPRSEALFTAAHIAELMAADPAAPTLPTPEQSQVIERELDHSTLVIAGAGSGKTETMANRVVWLVANQTQLVPSQILGLTFTRKAAGELRERVTARLQRFVTQLTDPVCSAQFTPQQRERAGVLHELMRDGLELPEVSTYNSFAASILQEFGPAAGVTAEATLIDDAIAWGIARNIVCTSSDPELIRSEDSIATIVQRVIQLDHAVADHLTSFARVRELAAATITLGDRPYREGKPEGRYADLTKVLANMEATQLTARLAEEFAAEKRRRGLIEFSDQLALAVRALERSPDAVRVLRERSRVVLLDEVQDTSVGQSKLLAMIFRGLPVMAVGDPHQSIYGFRGASASNLQSFHSDFRRESQPEATRRDTLTLSVSWRNPKRVLDAANTLSAPLAETLAQQNAALAVLPLKAKCDYLRAAEVAITHSNMATELQREASSDTAGETSLEVCVRETIEQEFQSLAAWIREARNQHLTQHGTQATAAVLFRSRRHMPAVSAALWEAGVPNRIVGLGGLLSTPEVTDVLCLLRCLWYADANNELLRLLAGPRFRIGVADLAGLERAARWYSKRDHEKQPLTNEDLHRGALPVTEQQFTLLDTLDEIATLARPEHRALRDISAIGRERLHEAGTMLRELRGEVGSDVLAVIRSAILHLRLDIELDAAEHTGYEGAAAARANLEAFLQMIETFLASDEHGTLASVLAWLERARENDDLAEHVPEPEPGTVQLITVHGAKGLEWDLVAVPRLVEGEFPASSREGMGWLRPGQLPDTLRGDAAARPRLTIEASDTQQDIVRAIKSYKEALQDRHADEERRLAYVAITRAAKRLLLTCSFWGMQQRATQTSRYLRELAEAGLLPEIPYESEHTENPREGMRHTMTWPTDPLGSRAPQLLKAAEVLRTALHEVAEDAPLSAHPVVELLLAERERESAVEHPGTQPIAWHTLPERVTASSAHEFLEDPVAAERRRARPLPQRPYRRTRIGNLFHEWVERRSSTALGSALTLSGIDFDEFAASHPAGGEDHPAATGQHASDTAQQEALAPLIEQFEKSRWADRQAVAVELEITLPFAGRTLVCKLDAVYRNEGSNGEPTRYEIVDWKSGRAPESERERQSRFLQLELYRHAYARWADVRPEDIDVTLFYVSEGVELRSEHPRSFAELETLWRQAEASLR